MGSRLERGDMTDQAEDKPVQTCSCGADCRCGCQQGQPCRCGGGTPPDQQT